MSAVLTKKIQASSGVPPSILRMQAFWAQLCVQIASWSLDTFEGEIVPEIKSRRVINGKEARDLLDTSFMFAFPDKVPTGLCAVALDDACVAHYAARRLNEEVANLDGASQIFLKLVSEDPACDLRRTILAGLAGYNEETPSRPAGDPVSASGSFVPSGRYMKVDIGWQTGNAALSVSLLFIVESVLQFSRDLFRDASSRSGWLGGEGDGALRSSIRATNLSISAVLDRLQLSVGACSRLTVGQVLELPNVEPNRLALTAETLNGNLDIGYGEMGVWKQNRALKLNTPILDSFVRNISDL